MTLAPPDRLVAALADRYRIERALGAGGMATVYLAEDLKHDRKVAIKVLKPELAAVLGAERFVQEIKTTAALSHPHILPLFDSGEADSFLYYVMPYIEGETIRDRLNRETQLSVDEAVRITREIADALDYAHRHGVVHRDIKPENLLLHDGRAMVMDFGIALAVSAAAGGRMTETGLSLGTPHYMSPEQATADKTITGRSDIYSLASVCYEMFTGEPPHTGSSAQQIIMKIIAEPVTSVTALRKAVPPHVAAALGMALQKLPADRFATAKEFADALANPGFATTAVGIGAGGALPALRDRRLLGTVAIAVLASATALAGWFRPAPDAPVRRYLFVAPDSQNFLAVAPMPQESPDGSYIVFHGPSPDSRGTSGLWIKRREDSFSTPIRGTSAATAYALSPDGTEIAFESLGSLRVVSVGGGVARVLRPNGVSNAGLAWLDDGTIVFSSPGPGPSLPLALSTIPAAGGQATELDLGTEGVAVIPRPLIGTPGFLYAKCVSLTDCDLWAYRIDNGKNVKLADGTGDAVHTATGHIVFSQGSSLVAQRFNARSLEVSGTPTIVTDDVQPRPNGMAYSLSRGGTLIALSGGSGTAGLLHEMVWVERNGRVTSVDPDWTSVQLTTTAGNQGWALSPDDRQLAIGLTTDAGDDIWVKQLPNGALTKLTGSNAPVFRPRWMPDGRAVLYHRSGATVARRADGVGPETVLSIDGATESLVSPDSQWLLVRVAGTTATASRDVFARRLTSTDTARMELLAEAYDEMAVSLSPDGRWMIYVSTETGHNEVYLRPFPDWNRLRVPVSVAGGASPLWSRDGREIFYLSADNQMMAVRFTAGPTPQVSAPVALFRVPAEMLAVEYAYYTPWDVARDGRFLMARRITSEASSLYPVVTENFFTILKERVPR